MPGADRTERVDPRIVTSICELASTFARPQPPSAMVRLSATLAPSCSDSTWPPIAEASDRNAAGPSQSGEISRMSAASLVGALSWISAGAISSAVRSKTIAMVGGRAGGT